MIVIVLLHAYETLITFIPAVRFLQYSNIFPNLKLGNILDFINLYHADCN